MIEAKAKGMKKDSYKKTRLGWIPEEWQVKRLSDLTSKIGSGTTPKGNGTNFGDNLLFTFPYYKEKSHQS